MTNSSITYIAHALCAVMCEDLHRDGWNDATVGDASGALEDVLCRHFSGEDIRRIAADLALISALTREATRQALKAV